MIVILPSTTSHSISFIGRYEPTIACTLTLYNEATKVETVVANTFATVNGITTVNFDFTFVESDKYQVKISDSNGVIFRGKLIATAQTPQDFKQTKDLYYYE